AGPTGSAIRRRAHGGPLPGARPQLSLELLGLTDLAQLDLHPAVEQRRPLDPLDRLLLRAALPDPVAGDELLRLGERTVDDGALTPVEPNPRRLGARVQAV